MLDKFAKSVARQVERLERLEAEGLFPPALEDERASFLAALKAADTAIIAEYKRASPSRGDLNLETSPEDAARAYENAGAAALSVLTEPDHFKGDPGFLARMAEVTGLPLLRKDFIAHPVQVLETASTPAAAMLAIARFDPYGSLPACVDLASRNGIEVVMEIFDEADLNRAREMNSKIIQVNSRDLDTLGMDPVKHERLIEKKAPGEFWIAASGINGGARIKELKNAGYGAFLIGTSLMSGKEPGQALAKIIKEAN